MTERHPERRLDPRKIQIGVLTSLLVLGEYFLGFGLNASFVAAAFVTALLTEFVAFAVSFGRGLPKPQSSEGFLDLIGRFYASGGYKSASITALSTSLLLRGEFWVAVLACGCAIVSKRLINLSVLSAFTGSTHRRHFFNPANLGIVAALYFGGGWITPGQWGRHFLLVAFLLCLGWMVTQRVKTIDITLSFLGTYAAILVTRALWLGDPLTLPMHAMSSGAVLLFAFFMISDPKTVPRRRIGRIIHGSLVALFAAYIRFFEYRSDGMIWGLFALAPLVPVLDILLERLFSAAAAAPRLKSSTPVFRWPDEIIPSQT